MIHKLFDACLTSLDWTARKMDPWFPGGMDYAKINVLLFCFIVPIVLTVSLTLNVLFLLGVL